MKKLMTNPLIQSPASGRKAIRSMDGKALGIIEDPLSVFWMYDDYGESDPDLSVWCRYSSDGTGLYRHSTRESVTGRLNLHGLPHTVYTSFFFVKFLLSHTQSNPVRIWATLQDRSRTRGMTFWLFGKKIHVMAQTSPLYEDSDAFLAKIEIDDDRRVTVNGEYRGIWPWPSS